MLTDILSLQFALGVIPTVTVKHTFPFAIRAKKHLQGNHLGIFSCSNSAVAALITQLGGCAARLRLFRDFFISRPDVPPPASVRHHAWKLVLLLHTMGPSDFHVSPAQRCNGGPLQQDNRCRKPRGRACAYWCKPGCRAASCLTTHVHEQRPLEPAKPSRQYFGRSQSIQATAGVLPNH